MKFFLQICFTVFLVLLGQKAVNGEGYNLSPPDYTFTSLRFDPLRTYDNNLNNSWKLTVDKGYRVVLYFTEFDLEDSFLDVPCALDFVEIKDGEQSSNSTFGRFCGNPELYSEDAPKLYTQKFKSTDNVMTVIMQSDYSNDTPDQPQPVGFRAHFHAEDINECEIPRTSDLEQYDYTGRCEHYCNNVLGSYYCSCRAGYRLAKDGFNCIGICGGTINDVEGTITTPGYPVQYSRLTNCTWKIMAEPGKRVTIQFEGEFGIEQYRDTGRCDYDWLKIEDGNGAVGTYCGNHLPLNGAEFTSITNWVNLQFHSDSLVEAVGFQVSYQSRGIQCAVPEPPLFGYVDSADITKSNGDLYVPFGSFIYFSCELGFRLIGEAKAACLKDGTLSEYTPKCEDF